MQKRTLKISKDDVSLAFQRMLLELDECYGQKQVANLLETSQSMVSKYSTGLNGAHLPEEKYPQVAAMYAQLLRDVPQIKTEAKVDEPEGAWLSKSVTLSTNAKRGLAKYAVSHFVRYGVALQIGSGTTFNFLMDEIIHKQSSQDKSLDLIVLTTSIVVFEKGLELQKRSGSLDDNQIVLTGGAYLGSLESLVGPYAEEGVHTNYCNPDYIFIGAKGLTFNGAEVGLCYQFEKEIGVQEAYATRPAVNRVILCDHTKLGDGTHWKARKVTAEALLRNAESCVIVSTMPKKGDDRMEVYGAVIKREIESFKALCARLRKAGGFDSRQLSLRFVDDGGKLINEINLHE